MNRRAILLDKHRGPDERHQGAGTIATQGVDFEDPVAGDVGKARQRRRRGWRLRTTATDPPSVHVTCTLHPDATRTNIRDNATTPLASVDDLARGGVSASGAG